MSDIFIDIVIESTPIYIDVVVDSEPMVFDVIIPPIELTPEVRTDWQDPYNYIGKAFKGSAEDSAVWTITRIEISASGTVVEEIILTNVKWTDRLTLEF